MKVLYMKLKSSIKKTEKNYLLRNINLNDWNNFKIVLGGYNISDVLRSFISAIANKEIIITKSYYHNYNFQIKQKEN